jgi:hypothetical protein
MFSNTSGLSHSNFRKTGIITLEIPDTMKLVAWYAAYKKHDIHVLLLLLLLFILYFTLVRSKVEYASVVWNSITSTDANKLERIQQKFTALCFKRFFSSGRLLLQFCFRTTEIAHLTKEEIST